MLADNEQPTLLPVPQVEQERTEVAGSLSLLVRSDTHGSGRWFVLAKEDCPFA